MRRALYQRGAALGFNVGDSLPDSIGVQREPWWVLRDQAGRDVASIQRDTRIKDVIPRGLHACGFELPKLLYQEQVSIMNLSRLESLPRCSKS